MKNVFIMGASSGIGLELAEILASRGVKLALAARHTETMHELKGKYPELVEYASIDITHKDAPAKMRELAEKTGGIDIYIHISGIGYENRGLDPEREVDIVRTNACGFARMVSAAYNYFREAGKTGQIAAVTSIAGTNGIGLLSAYSASKAFDQTYIVALRQLANKEKTGISFTDIRPGWVRTPLLKPGEAYPLEIDVDFAARRILKAIVRKEKVAVIDWRWDVISRLWRVLPDSVWTKMDVKISSPASPQS